MANSPKASIHRMVMPDHICPYGLKTKALLERKGYDVEDNWLETRDETDAFQKQYDVKTTPQTFINQQRIGGYDDVRRFFGHHFPQEGETSYRPIIVLFSMAFFLAVAVTWMSATPVATITFLERFVAIAMCLLAVQKLQDVEGFSTMFLNYDLLARRYVPYGYIYPFAEAAAGLLMLAGALTWVSAPLALLIGGFGAVSVFKAVYIDRRELKCACVGGNSSVPLGFVSLTENLMMVSMGVWMPVRLWLL
ncbi:MAG: glutaredoxin [Roseovarius sp.]|nr:glutaredoxin [Roseovarius sp.]|tara:strand:- start:3935 stop:4684 length:750 start_codon:yes stop_codon:yes gene_type:complete